jgi:hypothetical protein
MKILNNFLDRIRLFIGLKQRDKNLEYYRSIIKLWGGDRDFDTTYYGIEKLDSIVDKYYTGYILWPHRTNYCPIDKYREMKMTYIIRVIVDGDIYEKYYPEHGYDNHK